MPILKAAQNGYKQICEILIAAGADVNKCSKVSSTTEYFLARLRPCHRCFFFHIFNNIIHLCVIALKLIQVIHVFYMLSLLSHTFKSHIHLLTYIRFSSHVVSFFFNVFDRVGFLPFISPPKALIQTYVRY